MGFLLYQEQAIRIIYQYKDFIRTNFILSLCILIGAHIIGCLLVIPGAIFGIILGFIFGTNFDGNILGYFLCVFALLTIGSIAGIITMNFSRLLFREKLRRVFIDTSVRMRKIDFILTNYGTKALFLFRLSPIVPVSLFNYLLGAFNGIN